MKAEIKTKEKGFEPIELNITIESMEELKELCARLCMLSNEVNEVVDDYGKIKDTVGVDDLWEKLDKFYEKYK